MSTVRPFLDNVATFFALNEVANAGGGFGMGGLNAAANLAGGLLNNNNSNRPARVMIASDADAINAMDNQDRRDRDESRATTAAIVGGIAAVGLAALSAFNLRGYCDAQEFLESAVEFREQELPHLEDNVRNEMRPLVNEAIRVGEAKLSKSRNILILTGLALGSAIAGFLGGMLSAQWLVTAAIIVGVVTLAVTAFAIVWYCTDSHQELQESTVARFEAMRAQFN